MNPKEKAYAINQRFMIEIAKFTGGQESHAPLFAKRLAGIAIDEVLVAKHKCGCEESVRINGKTETYHTYWKQVKKELEKL